MIKECILQVCIPAAAAKLLFLPQSLAFYQNFVLLHPTPTPTPTPTLTLTLSSGVLAQPVQSACFTDMKSQVRSLYTPQPEGHQNFLNFDAPSGKFQKPNPKFQKIYGIWDFRFMNPKETCGFNMV